MSSESHSVRPDQVIPPEGLPVPARSLIADAVFLLPNIVKMVSRILRDPRVPRRAKVTLGLAAAYIVSPIDLIPDKLPVIGWVDDVFIMMLALDSLIHRAGPDVVAEHWDGPGDILRLVREVMALSRSFVPRRISVVIDRVAG